MQNVLRRSDHAVTHALVPVLLRYGLALVMGWIGYAKFFGYEAEAIAPLVSTSPVMSWTYHVLSVRQFSAVLGVVEVSCAVLLCLRRVSPRLSLLGGLIAVVLFLSTLSFLLTSPHVFQDSAGGFPHLAESGEFLIKDVVLLGASLWALADSWHAVDTAAEDDRALPL